MVAELLLNEICPEALPVAAGANCAVYLAVCPGVSVSGSVIPLPLNPVPEVEICEIVRLALPLLLIVTDCVPELPTVTLPKLRLTGLTVSCATGAAAPVPLSEISVGLLEALLVKVICPEALPTAVGANCAM